MMVGYDEYPSMQVSFDRHFSMQDIFNKCLSLTHCLPGKEQGKGRRVRRC